VTLPGLTEWEKLKVEELLDEHSRIKGPEQLRDFNIRAETLLFFIAMRNPDILIEES
jgi:hypothetical protein